MLRLNIDVDKIVGEVQLEAEFGHEDKCKEKVPQLQQAFKSGAGCCELWRHVTSRQTCGPMCMSLRSRPHANVCGGVVPSATERRVPLLST
eukprot:33146-Eustigmatos_ZCMA.PRE.1